MKTLAEQAWNYMQWRSARDGREFTASDLAAEVARHQRGIEDASKCKRQDIENLFKKDIRNPRYIAALASAMGSTVEHLKAGKYEPGVINTRLTTHSASPPMSPQTGVQMSETVPLMAEMQAGNTSRRAPVVAWARLGDVVFEEVINKANSLAFAPIGDHGDRVILVPIADDALAPRLRIGDMVAIDLDNKQPDRDQVTLFMAKADGAFFLRRYQPLVAPHFEAIDAKNGALDSQRHGLEVIGVRCGVRLADI